MRIWILAIATVAVLIGAVGGAYWYGGNGADESALVLNRAPAASDGIKVHGDWTLTVSNPDGSVDSIHEFRNKLTGAFALMMLMRGEGIRKNDDGSNQWQIVFWNGEVLDYQIVPADTSFLYPNPLGDNEWVAMDAFQLMGSFIVPPEWGDLAVVRTVLRVNNCLMPTIDKNFGQNSSGTSGNCSSDAGLTVTQKYFDNPISVQPGQGVLATVRISFE